jgi:hypothetical protein
VWPKTCVASVSRATRRRRSRSRKLAAKWAAGCPCIGKASDGGDIGCRYTPEMMEMIQKALELRAKGIIKF